MDIIGGTLIYLGKLPKLAHIFTSTSSDLINPVSASEITSKTAADGSAILSRDIILQR